MEAIKPVMQKSTVQTSRKIYAMKFGIHSILIFNFIGFGLNFLKAGTVQSGTLIAVTASIGAIVTGLQIADGFKGHEKKHDSDSL